MRRAAKKEREKYPRSIYPIRSCDPKKAPYRRRNGRIAVILPFFICRHAPYPILFSVLYMSGIDLSTLFPHFFVHTANEILPCIFARNVLLFPESCAILPAYPSNQV